MVCVSVCAMNATHIVVLLKVGVFDLHPLVFRAVGQDLNDDVFIRACHTQRITAASSGDTFCLYSVTFNIVSSTSAEPSVTRLFDTATVLVPVAPFTCLQNDLRGQSQEPAGGIDANQAELRGPL